MAASERHFDVAEKVVELIKAEDLGPFKSSDVRLEEFPFIKEPAFGIAVSLSKEQELTGLNDKEDIYYTVQITRILTNLSLSDAMKSRSQFRVSMRNLFNHKRIGVDENEIITHMSFGQIIAPKEFTRSNIDTSVCYVSCLIRETRT